MSWEAVGLLFRERLFLYALRTFGLLPKAAFWPEFRGFALLQNPHACGEAQLGGVPRMSSNRFLSGPTASRRVHTQFDVDCSGLFMMAGAGSRVSKRLRLAARQLRAR